MGRLPRTYRTILIYLVFYLEVFIMKFIYPAIFRKTTKGTFEARFPDLECCTATGETLDDCIENANQAAYDWIYVELTEFDSELPPITDPDDLVLDDSETLRNISVNIRLTDGWDE